MKDKAAPIPVFVSESEVWRILGIVLFGEIFFIIVAIYLDQVFAEISSNEFYSLWTSLFLITYKFMMIFLRYKRHGAYAVFEALWGCNVAITLVAIAALINRPFLISLAMTTVSGDQICWYIDGVSYLISGRFQIGVITYLFYPENRSFSKQFFASHHIWFLPFCLMLTREHNAMPLVTTFPATTILTAIIAIYSRLVSPFQLRNSKDKGIVYLNLNGCYAFWRDVPISILHTFDFQHPIIYIPFLSLVICTFVNGIPHLLLMGIARLVSTGN